MPANIRIAYITPEAPPFSGGGIATFINNITLGMKKAGVYCEVFAPTDTNENYTTELNGVTMHRIVVPQVSSFSKEVVPLFLKRHAEVRFTIVESCEIHASLLELMKEKRPELKYVIRVQMPVVQQLRLNNHYQSFGRKLRYLLGAFRRLRWDFGAWNKIDVKRKSDPEYLVCEQADAIIAPSVGFKEWLINFWRLNEKDITVIPHLFNFSLMQTGEEERQEEDGNIRILFTGKLNAHKGVINLARASNRIWQKYPNVEFILIGEDWPTEYRNKKRPTSEILREITHEDQRFILLGKVPYKEIGGHYAQADICIFPSLWEAWGYTCTEAMSMGKAVIGSKYGGMADAIDHGKNSLLINPYSVSDIVQKLEQLISDKDMRERLGVAARKTIENELSFDKLMKQNLDFYQRLVDRV